MATTTSSDVSGPHDSRGVMVGRAGLDPEKDCCKAWGEYDKSLNTHKVGEGRQGGEHPDVGQRRTHHCLVLGGVVEIIQD